MELIDALPEDSLLHLWLTSRSIIETPISFDLLGGMSFVGALAKRDVWVDQVEWKLFPATSVLYVGPSGIGKNTAINGVEALLQGVKFKIVGGKTIETLTDQACKLGDPACGVILAKELSDLLGKKDYQQGLLSGLTDLMDTQDFKEITIKSDNYKRLIKHPTITILAGSTKDWLHKALPGESQVGGFLPRFMIICEDKVKRYVPLVKALPKEELEVATAARSAFLEGIPLIPIQGLGEMPLSKKAECMYQDWYISREDQFSSVASDYAHRSRDHALRAAMVCALSRLRKQIEPEDVVFGTSLLNYIAKRVDVAVAMPSVEGEVALRILRMLPAAEHTILREMSRAYSPRHIREALGLLRDSRQVRRVGERYHAHTETD